MTWQQGRRAGLRAWNGRPTRAELGTHPETRAGATCAAEQSRPAGGGRGSSSLPLISFLKSTQNKERTAVLPPLRTTITSIVFLLSQLLLSVNVKYRNITDNIEVLCVPRGGVGTARDPYCSCLRQPFPSRKDTECFWSARCARAGPGRCLEPRAPGDGAGSGDSCPCFTRKTLTCPNVVWDCLKLEEGVSPKDRHAGWVIPAPRRRHLDRGLLPACSPSPACRHGACTAHGGVRCPTLPACAAHLREKTHCLRCERCHGLPRAPSVPSPGASGTPS